MRRRELVHRGVIDALGFVFDPAIIGMQQLHERVLACASDSPSPRVLQLDADRVLVLFAKTRRVKTANAIGLPVVGVMNRVAATPDAGPQSVDSVAWFQAGERFERTLTNLSPVDMAAWLSVDVPLYVCRAFEPPVPPVHATHLPVNPDSLREQIGAPPSDPSVEEMIREAREARERQRRGGTGPMFGGANSARGSGGRGGGKGLFANSPEGSLGAALRKFLSPDQGMSDALAKKHEQYLRDLEKQFLSGNLTEALKRAIPLGGGVGELMQALGVFRPRNKLEITGGNHGSGIAYGPNVDVGLRNLYTNAAKKLEEDGRYSEAAFVLAELLNDPLAAIALLERHKMYEMALDIARKRKVADELITRLFWRAGRRAEAMAWARRTGCHSVVANFLENADPEEAFAFRVHWVTDLEQSGAYSAALSVGWSDERVRPFLAGVIEKAVEAGGPTALPMHAYRVALRPTTDHLDDALAAIRENASDISALAKLIGQLDSIGVQNDVAAMAVDRQFVTTLLRTTLLHPAGLPKPTMKEFYRLCGRADGLFRADSAKPRAASTAENSVTAPSPEVALPAGVSAVFDAVLLANGCVLVALGEVGAAMLRPNGEVVAKWTQPTHVLVQSDYGNNALLLTQRSAVLDIHVLDTATRKVRRYGTIESTKFARSFDGQTWAAFARPGLCFFNTHASEPTYDWCELDDTLMLHSLSRESHELVAVTTPNSNPEAVELWRWRLPNMDVIERNVVPIASYASFFDVTQNGYVYVADPRADPTIATHRVGVGSDAEEVPPGIRSGYTELAFATSSNPTSVYHVPHIQGTPVKYFTVPQLSKVGMRALSNVVTVFDVDGRVVIFEVEAKRILAAFSMPATA